MDIFQLAVLYLITRLENVSIHYLELKISKSNVLDALYYADKMKWVITSTVDMRRFYQNSIQFSFQFKTDQRSLHEFYC